MIQNTKLSEKEISIKLKSLEINNIDCLFVANDLGKVGLIQGKNKKYLLDCIYSNIINLNPGITIVVPTANLNLINSEKIFDLDNTPSYRMGAFSEYVRNLKGAKRSFNPLWSLSAIGPLAEKIVNNVSDHAYDMNSSFSKLFNIKNSFFLSIGQHPRYMLSIIHHLEHINKVPYRFTKEFEIKCIDNSKLIIKKFKLDVLREEFRYLKRSFNKKIFENFEKKNNFYETSFGKGKIYYFNLEDFYFTTCELFKKDINCWWK